MYATTFLRNIHRIISLSTCVLLTATFVTILNTAHIFRQSSLPVPLLKAQPMLHHSSHRYVMLLDCWERMINIQTALHRLLHIAIDANFTLVEPYVYQSKISLSYSLPEMFTVKNLTPQPASLYFQTHYFLLTNHYILFSTLRKLFINSCHSSHIIIQAAIFFDWQSPNTSITPTSNTHIYMCDHRISHLPLSPLHNARSLTPTTHIRHAICIPPTITMSPITFNNTLFEQIFALAGSANFTPQTAPLTIALFNYRKHAFSGFTSPLRQQPHTQKVPPLSIASYPHHLASQIQAQTFSNRPYIAAHFRAGKPFVQFSNWQALQNIAQKPHAPNISHAVFANWSLSCATRLAYRLRKAQVVTKMPVYLASDLFNDGWKGGESAPHDVLPILDQVRSILMPFHRFQPLAFELTQDRMGISAAVDAAVCVRSNWFMFVAPSNFGTWIAEQRGLVGQDRVSTVDCHDYRLT